MCICNSVYIGRMEWEREEEAMRGRGKGRGLEREGEALVDQKVCILISQLGQVARALVVKIL